jgi:ElaB/YqjD/DUF883 family membrane-anchored ribosome-binding protein
MKTKLEELAEQVKKLAEESKGNMGETVTALKDSPEWNEARAVASDLAEDAADFVRRYPLQSVLGAAALGFLLGSMVKRKR